MTRSSTVYPAAIVALLALAVFAPIVTLLLQSLVPAANPLPAFIHLFGTRVFWTVVAATLVVAVATTAVAIVLGTTLALLVVRSDLPGRNWLEPAVLASILVPPPAIAFGLLSVGVPAGWPALIAVSGLVHAPVAYLCIAATLRSRNADAEEAGRVAGVSAWRIATGVSVPMLAQPLAFAAALVGALAIAQLALPHVLGEPAGIRVLSTDLYALAQERAATPAIDTAALATVMMIMLAPLMAILWWLAGRRFAQPERLLALGRQPDEVPLRLRNWRGLAIIAVAIWIIASFALPLASIVTLIPTSGFAMPHAASTAVGNSVALALLGGALAVAIYAVLAFVLLRLPSPRRRYAVGLAVTPWVMPGLVIGLVILWLFTLTTLAPSMITAWLAYVLAFLPIGMALAVWSYRPIDPTLADVSRLAGANRWHMTLGVTLTLMRDRSIVGWLVIVALFIRETATGAFLLNAGAPLIGPTALAQWRGGNAATAAAIALIAVTLIGLTAAAAFALARRDGARVHG